jgi:hypothetical protein
VPEEAALATQELAAAYLVVPATAPSNRLGFDPDHRTHTRR